jgi:hypothetical protein
MSCELQMTKIHKEKKGDDREQQNGTSETRMAFWKYKISEMSREKITK